MTKVLLLSDTHSYIDEQILKFVNQADEVWHAGDIGSLNVTDTIKKHKPLRAVYGNIDDNKTRIEFPLNNLFEVENVKVLMTHIAGYPTKYNKRATDLIKKHKPKIFICGHSHILKIQFDKTLNILHLNPGACGKYGFHSVRTMLRFELDKGDIKNMEVIELETRK